MLALATGTTVTAPAGASLAVASLVMLAFALIEIVAFWRIFTKAGEPGWASLIPIYNGYVLLRIAGRPGWWLLLYLIPFVNFVMAIIVVHELSKSFGHGGGFTFGLLFLPVIFYPMLAFGSDRYLGPGGSRPIPEQLSPPAGWYADPSSPESTAKRWWDGKEWTTATSDQHWHGPGH